MAIVQVRELIIRATVVREGAAEGAGNGTNANNDISPAEEIIKTCVEKVLEILKEKDER